VPNKTTFPAAASIRIRTIAYYTGTVPSNMSTGLYFAYRYCNFNDFVTTWLKLRIFLLKSLLAAISIHKNRVANVGDSPPP
jgi:hypothetical protein